MTGPVQIKHAYVNLDPSIPGQRHEYEGRIYILNNGYVKLPDEGEYYPPNVVELIVDADVGDVDKS